MTAHAKKALAKIRLTSSIEIEIRKHFLKACVCSVVLNECETSTVGKKDSTLLKQRRVNVLLKQTKESEVCYSRLMKVS